MSSCVLVDVIETNENIVVMEATIMLFTVMISILSKQSKL